MSLIAFCFLLVPKRGQSGVVSQALSAKALPGRFADPFKPSAMAPLRAAKFRARFDASPARLQANGEINPDRWHEASIARRRARAVKFA
jgi:hypothetical protein